MFYVYFVSLVWKNIYLYADVNNWTSFMLNVSNFQSYVKRTHYYFGIKSNSCRHERILSVPKEIILFDYDKEDNNMRRARSLLCCYSLTIVFEFLIGFIIPVEFSDWMHYFFPHPVSTWSFESKRNAHIYFVLHTDRTQFVNNKRLRA